MGWAGSASPAWITALFMRGCLPAICWGDQLHRRPSNTVRHKDELVSDPSLRRVAAPALRLACARACTTSAWQRLPKAMGVASSKAWIDIRSAAVTCE